MICRGRLIATAAFSSLSISASALAQPTVKTIEPIYPAPGAKDLDTRKPFQLPSISKDNFCEIRVGDDAALKGPLTVRVLEPGAASADLQRDLQLSKQYYWQAVCRESEGTQPLVSQTRVLTFSTFASIPAPPGVTARTPSDGATRLNVWQRQLFTWDRVEGATSYELVLRAGATGKPRDKESEEETKILVDFPRQVNPVHPKTGEPMPPYATAELEAGKQYYWQVNAIREGRIVAQLPERSLTTQSDAFDAAKGAGFRLKRAFTLLAGDEKDEAAAFGLQGTKGERPTYSAEFALGWSGHAAPFAGATLTPGASVEARLHSSGESKETDAVKVRLTGKWDFTFDKVPWFAATSLKYESSRDAETKKVLAEFLFTPTDKRFWIGQAYPAPSHYTGTVPPGTRPLTFSWRPYFGLDVGRTLETGNTTETDRTLLRGLLRVSAQVGFAALAERLNIPAVTLFADNYYRYLPLEDSHRGNNYLETGLDFELNESVTFALRYNVGRDAPTFLFDRNFSVNLGLKF